jgi:hypothetical protein
MSNILYSLLAMVGGHESPTPPGPAAGAQIVQPRTGILKDMLALTREPVHCCSWVICTAAVVAFLRLRRLFVSGVFLSGFTACVRARAQRQPLCVLWHAWSSCAKPDYMCVRGVCRAAAAAVLGCDVVFVRRAGFFFCACVVARQVHAARAPPRPTERVSGLREQRVGRTNSLLH